MDEWLECDSMIFVFFFFKQKTAYEMRISDWSSDVCSSDLCRTRREYQGHAGRLWRGRGHHEPDSAMASAVGRPSGRSPVTRSVTERTLIVGSASAILLAACVLPLLWPLIGLATGGRGVDLGLIADPALWSLLARTLVVTAAVLAQIGRAHV